MDIQIKWFECWVDAHVILLKTFALSNPLQRLDGAADELRYVVDSSQYFCIRVLLNKFEQLSVDHLNACDLVRVLVQDLVLAKNFILFSNVFFGERLLQLIPPFLQFQDKLIETLVNVARLLLVQSLDFLLDMFDELAIVIIDSLRIKHQLVQVVNVLLYDIRHIFKLRKFVPVVVREHTF